MVEVEPGGALESHAAFALALVFVPEMCFHVRRGWGPAEALRAGLLVAADAAAAAVDVQGGAVLKKMDLGKILLAISGD